MKNYKVTDIKWCVDDPMDLETLPTEVTISAEDEDMIADELSDTYGFLVESFAL